MGYEKCYYKLFNAATDAINQLQGIMMLLQAAQLETEDLLTSDDSPISAENEDK